MIGACPTMSLVRYWGLRVQLWGPRKIFDMICGASYRPETRRGTVASLLNMASAFLFIYVCGHVYRHTHSFCGMCTDAAVDMYTGICLDMRIALCITLCEYMCVGLCVDIQMDMSMDLKICV